MRKKRKKEKKTRVVACCQMNFDVEGPKILIMQNEQNEMVAQMFLWCRCRKRQRDTNNASENNEKKTERNNNVTLISCMHLNKRCVCAIASAFRRNVSILIMYYCKMQIAICFREIYVSILVLFHAATISAAFLLCVDPANGHVRAAFCKQTNK